MISYLLTALMSLPPLQDAAGFDPFIRRIRKHSVPDGLLRGEKT